MLRSIKHKQKGYAIAVVLILLVIGTATLIMTNRESFFFTKIAGFFARSKKIQAQAQAGLDLAKSDLSTIGSNSRRQVTSGLNTFRNLTTGGASAALNQGLYFDSGATRTLTPRISRPNVDGDIQLRVFYFPEDPCADVACSSEAEYNKRLPKRFIIVSEAANSKTGEVFSIESRVQVKLENFAEISFGVMGKGSYPPDGTSLLFAPALYGRSHFGLPANSIEFTFNNSDMENRSNQHIFNDLVTFQDSATSDGYPFTITEHQIQQQQLDGLPQPVPGLYKKPMMNFKKGYQSDVDLIPQGGNYDPNYDPASDTFFNNLQAKAESVGGGVNLAASLPAGTGNVDICLKFVGAVLKRYNCNYLDSTDKIMPRIDMNIHPEFQTYLNGHGTYADGEDEATRFNSGSTVSSLMNDMHPILTSQHLYDRYEGEHSDVYNGTTANAVGSDIPASGIIYCRPNDGRICNVHIKGILDGNVTIAADRVTIEGDIVYQNQNSVTSDDMLGVIAKEDIIIPATVPQSSTSAGAHDTYWQNARQFQAADNQNPVGDDNAGTTMPTSLAESYLGITNFIPVNSGEYTDRDDGSVDYKEYANWISLGDIDTNTKYYNSPTALDLDGNFFAGNVVKVDGIFNPEQGFTLPNSAPTGMAVLTCENPGGAATGNGCTDYKYRNLTKTDNSADALYANNDRTVLATGADGNPVKPLFWVDGLENDYMTVGGCGDNFPGSCSDPAATNYKNVEFQMGEEVARISNPLMHVYGSINSKFFLIYDRFGTYYGKFRMGFKNKIITPDPRAASMFPPGFPSTYPVKVDELYQKIHRGRSALVPN
jgi:hypothetical protein